MKNLTRKTRRLMLLTLGAFLMVLISAAGSFLTYRTFLQSRTQIAEARNNQRAEERDRRVALAVQTRLMELRKSLPRMLAAAGGDPFTEAPAYFRKEVLAAAQMRRTATGIEFPSRFINPDLLESLGAERSALSRIYQAHPLPLAEFFQRPGTELLNRSIALPGSEKPLPVVTFLIPGTLLAADRTDEVIAVDFVQTFLIEELRKAGEAEFFLVSRRGTILSHPDPNTTLRYASQIYPHPAINWLSRAYAEPRSGLLNHLGQEYLCHVRRTPFRDIMAVSLDQPDLQSLAMDVLTERPRDLGAPVAAALGPWLVGLVLLVVARRRRRRRQISLMEAGASLSEEDFEEEEEATSEVDLSAEKEVQTPAAASPPMALAPDEPLRGKRLTQIAQSANIADLVRGQPVHQTASPHPQDLETFQSWLRHLMSAIPEKKWFKRRKLPPPPALPRPDFPLQLKLPGVSLAGFQDPGKGGGDFFHAHTAPTGVQLFLGTVLGENLPGSYRKSVSRALALALAGEMRRHPLAGPELLERVNDAFIKGGEGMAFASLCVIEFPSDKNEVTVCNAGHQAPLRLRSPGSDGEEGDEGDTRVDVWMAEGEILGTNPEPEYEARHYEFNAGDLIALYSEGIPSARNKKSQPWGEGVFLNLLAEAQTADPEELIAQLTGELHRHTGGVALGLDASLLVLGRNAETMRVSPSPQPQPAPISWHSTASVVPETAEPAEAEEETTTTQEVRPYDPRQSEEPAESPGAAVASGAPRPDEIPVPQLTRKRHEPAAAPHSDIPTTRQEEAVMAEDSPKGEPPVTDWDHLADSLAVSGEQAERRQQMLYGNVIPVDFGAEPPPPRAGDKKAA